PLTTTEGKPVSTPSSTRAGLSWSRPCARSPRWSVASRSPTAPRAKEGHGDRGLVHHDRATAAAHSRRRRRDTAHAAWRGVTAGDLLRPRGHRRLAAPGGDPPRSGSSVPARWQAGTTVHATVVLAPRAQPAGSDAAAPR